MQVPILLLWNFVGNKLVARMALLDKGEVEETYFLIAMTIFFFGN